MRAEKEELDLCDLSPSCLKKIRHSVLVKKMTHEEAAIFHKVKLVTVFKIMSSMIEGDLEGLYSKCKSRKEKTKAKALKANLKNECHKEECQKKSDRPKPFQIV